MSKYQLIVALWVALGSVAGYAVAEGQQDPVKTSWVAYNNDGDEDDEDDASSFDQQKMQKPQPQKKTTIDEADENAPQFPTEYHKGAYNSLSPKNRTAYNGLEEHEQDEIAETYRNGGNPQKTLSNCLNNDQKKYDKEQKAKKPRMSKEAQMNNADDETYDGEESSQEAKETPATQAMKKENMSKPKEGNVFSDN